MRFLLQLYSPSYFCMVSDNFAMRSSSGSKIEMTLSSSSHRIQKRSASTDQLNPCAGSLLQMIIYEADDWQDGTTYELVHDPGMKIVLSFFFQHSCLFFFFFINRNSQLLFPFNPYFFAPEKSFYCNRTGTVMEQVQ